MWTFFEETKTLALMLFPRFRRLVIVRGYRKARTVGKIGLVQEIKYSISTTQSPVNNVSLSEQIFSKTIEDPDLLVRQYLTVRTGETSLVSSIYSALGGGAKVFRLPPHTHNVLIAHGVPVNKFMSSVVWRFYTFAFWLFGVLAILKFSSEDLGQKKQIGHGFEKAYFANLPETAGPNQDSKVERLDLLTWFAKNKAKSLGIKYMLDGNYRDEKKAINGVFFQRQVNPWPQFESPVARLHFIKWGFCNAVLSLRDFVLGRWWHPLLLLEAAKAKRMALSNDDQMPACYWLSHESYKYKPMWVHVAEKRDKSTFLYFYSTNNQTVQPASQKVVTSGYWHLMDWPTCVVWNEIQADILRSYIKSPCKFIVVRALPYTDSDILIPKIEGPVIAVFDAPVRQTDRAIFVGQAHRYATVKNVTDFYEDIIDMSTKHGIRLCVKQKHRPTQNPSSPLKLDHIIKQALDGVISVDARVSAHRVVKATDGCIALPYSSTALVANSMGKPSCYYDPTGSLPTSTSLSHGVKIIRSKQDLGKWIKENINH